MRKFIFCVAVITAAVSVAASLSCPLGFVPQRNSCVCADWPNEMVVCDEDLQQASMKIGYCMTYDNQTREVRAGYCINNLFRNDSYKLYYPLPAEASDLNDRVCAPSNSKGLLCGECQEGFSAAALWGINCINCTGTSNGWIKFVAVQYIPLTVIFIIIIAFSISIVSGPINSFIFFTQIIDFNIFLISALYTQDRTFSAYIHSLKSSPATIVATLYEAWNLNVAPRAYIPPFCLTSNFTGFQGFALRYITAFYPLILIVLLYVSIILHNRNFRPLVYCWKPFLNCFLRFRRSVDLKTSVIDAFATFILLSYGNLLNDVLLFLSPQNLYNGQGEKLSTSVMVFSPSTLFFHKEHIPLAIFSIFVSLTFIAIPPIVLTFYQFAFFQKCLTRCKMNSQALRTFVEAFQGCYKDGTNGTRDCRYFAGLYFILRVIATVIYSQDFEFNYFREFILLFGSTALLFALVQPYKEHIYNAIDAIIFGLLSAVYLFVKWNIDNIMIHGHTSTPLLVLTRVLYSLPLVYLVLFIVYWVLDRKTSCIQKLRRSNLLRCLWHDQEEQQRVHFDAIAPHRLLNPENYEQL